jgi:hypothetical protein
MALGLCCSTAVLGQGVPYSPATLQLTANNTQASQVPANSSSTLLTFTLEGDTTGQNSFDVVTTDPAVLVSLILPSSVEVTTANAASLGFTFTSVPNGTFSNVEIPSVLSFPGTHTLIQVPAGQPSGTYQIKANASNANSSSGLLATYFSSSTVGVTATTDAANYKVGNTVIISGLVFDGATPVTSATVTAAVSAPTPLAGSTTVGNIQLVSQQAINSSLTDYSYSATVTNTGAAVQSVRGQAQTSSLPAGIAVLNDTLVFGDVNASASATSLNTITIERNPSQSFDPATLQWTVTTPGTPVNVTLADSGTFDAATGDGVYTGTFTPTSTGTYTASLLLTGTSLAGNNFSRTTATQFQVTQQLAGFVSFTDVQQSGGVAITANVSVQTPGTYRFTLQLQATNQNLVQGGALVNLSTGSQQVAMMFFNDQMFGLGVSGPFERVNALLVFVGDSGDLIADSRADAGPTAAYTLGSFAPPLYFTGQNSAAGVVTGAGPTFDLLRVTIGVSNASARTCDWAATLTDLSGNRIAYSSSLATSVAAGSTSVTLDFNGNLIAQSVNGPYLVKNIAMHCGTDQATAVTLFQTQSFTTSQFTFVTSDFSLASEGTPPAAAAGSTFWFRFIGAAVGAFDGSVNLTASGLPAGASGLFTIPTLLGVGETTLIVTTGTSTPPGSYPIVITGTSGALVHTTTATLTVIVTLPTVVAVRVLFGSQSFDLLTSTRIRLPWQVTAIQVVFSRTITTADTSSITGVTVTGISGLGTNTITWTINPLTNVTTTASLLGTGAHAIKDGAGNAIATFNQGVKVLYGDFNDDGFVTSQDMAGVFNATVQPYNKFADINGDGVVNTPDVGVVRTRLGTTNP